MAIEAGLIKPVVDAILGLVQGGRRVKLKRDAEKALQEAIRELLAANPNHSQVEAKIAVAKAAGIISQDLIVADDMLSKVKAHAGKVAKRTSKVAAKAKKSVKAFRRKSVEAFARRPNNAFNGRRAKRARR
jgi:hypothetical protein